MKQRSKDRYHLVDGVVVSCAGTVRKNDQICLISALCELKSSKMIQKRPMEANSMPSLKIWSANEDARVAAKAKVVRGRKKDGPSQFPALEQSAVRKYRGGREK